MVSLTKDWFKNTRNFLASSYIRILSICLYFITNLLMWSSIYKWIFEIGGFQVGSDLGVRGLPLFWGLGSTPPQGKWKTRGGSGPPPQGFRCPYSGPPCVMCILMALFCRVFWGGQIVLHHCLPIDWLTLRSTSKARALGSPSGSLEHRC